MELDEADLVAVESEPVPDLRQAAKASLPLPTLPPFRSARGTLAGRAVRTRTLTPRRMLDEGVEEVVAGECLATIKSLAPPADAASSSHVRAAMKRPSVMRPPPLPPAARAAQPFADEALTAPRVPLPPGLPAGPTLVPAAFVRVSGHSAVSSSVAPVTAEPTVIVVRGRPRAAWVFGAAALGAFVAIAAGRLLTSPAPEATPPVVAVAATAPPEALPSTAVTAPPSGLAPAVALPPMPLAKPKPPAVVTFADDQGVAIKAAPRVAAPPPPRAAAAPVAVAPPRASAPAPSPAKSGSVSGALPDGSLALGGSASPVAARPAPPPVAPAPVAPPAPEAPKKKALTPEQQLAEAQLKASMR